MNSAAPSLVLGDLVVTAHTRSQRIARDAVLVSLAVLFTAASAQISIPLGFTPVPLTMQTFAVLLTGAVLGVRRSAISMSAYWVAGLVGLPFYQGGKGGWAEGTGATMGYLVGFIAAAAFVGMLAERRHDRTFATSLPAMVMGSAIIYAFGVSWLAFKLNIGLAVGDPNAIELGVAPFLLGDAMKTLAAAACTSTVWVTLRRRG
jgi:biotin transport system substrate-specific component